MVNLKRFQYFVAAVESENIKTAAQGLEISSQGLKKQLLLLEKELGGELFRIQEGELILSSLGTFVYERLMPIMKQVDESLLAIQSVKKAV